MRRFYDFVARPGLISALSNFGWLAAERVVRLALGVLVGFWVARHLGPSRFGTLSFCLAVVTLLGFAPALGLEPVLRREIIRRPHEAGVLLATALRLRLIAGLVMFVLLLIGAQGASGWISGEERRLLFVLGVLLFQPAFFVPDIWLQATLRAKYASVAQVTGIVAASTSRVVLILTDAPLIAYAAVFVGELIIVAAGLWWMARSQGLRPPPWRGFDAAQAGRLIGKAWPLMFAGLAVVIYMRIDEVMLRQMLGSAAVGIYSAAVRISEIWYFIPVAMASSLMPALLRSREQSGAAYHERMQRFFDLNAGVAYLLAVPIALLSGWIVRLAYGSGYAQAGAVLTVHIWSSMFVFLGLARGQWLVNEGRTRFYLVATLIGAAANVAMNLVLIPRWGPLGAAWATLISYALAAWLTSYGHGPVRNIARMQTRALLLPVLGWRYLKRL